MATSPTKSYRDCIDRIVCPEVQFSRVLKEPGSKRLVLGSWIEVQPEDEDAIKKLGPPSRTSGGG